MTEQVISEESLDKFSLSTPLGNPDAQGMVRQLRSAGVSQTRISKYIQCPQANVSRWQSGLCKPNGESMVKLIALWKEKCDGNSPH